MSAAIMTGDEIRRAVSVKEAVAAVRDAFVALSRGEFEMPARDVLGDGRFFVMAAHHSPTSSMVVKTLSANFEGRVPAIVGTVMWYDRDRLTPLLAEAGTITSMRTGAASAVATDLLARSDASTLTVIGCGGQAADQIRAACSVRSIAELTLVDRAAGRAEGLADRMRQEFPSLKVRTETDTAVGVAGADIVCCATTSLQPLFVVDDLRADVHVNAIGAFRPSMRELPDDLLSDAAQVYVDHKHAVMEESGEVVSALASGAITESSLVDIGTAVTDLRGRPSGRTVFKTVGVAAEDWALMRCLAEPHQAS